MTDYEKAYFTTALWSSNDNDDNPLDQEYSLDDLAPETIAQAKKDIDAFLKAIESQGLDTSEHDSDQIMHDFWLTRNRHGAGFWDGDYEQDLGDKLTDISCSLGTIDLYAGDGGLIYST